VRQLEADNQALQADLGFFEGLMPMPGEGLQLRGLQADPQPGPAALPAAADAGGKATADFTGRYDLVLSGTLEGRPWSQTSPGPKPLQFRQYAGGGEHRPAARRGPKNGAGPGLRPSRALRATQSAKL
jgi:hypothetical protein